jgi:hypothetical protein
VLAPDDEAGAREARLEAPDELADHWPGVGEHDRDADHVGVRGDAGVDLVEGPRSGSPANRQRSWTRWPTT